ncbi:uncharacterized protein CLUP02_02211 [Colletotrichum lupini]|uniref:MARVEL domain-containing protein n=1 Tax=Colletotrichum lupini TaxID=145971 RepID=A0A9Q8SFI7_9PEZI|nr:uncharacterized protein CLUP02_02211 [Colletotrichum lupini]UQC75557.1 hypothetical protein CLUP02_02211 [Colletotrichum lupini]
MNTDYWQLSGAFGLWVRACIRILQFVFAIVTIGLYAATLGSWSTLPTDNLERTPWIYALVPAVLSALTCAYHVFATVTHAAWSVWDFGLAVLWAALCGLSSSMVVGGEKSINVTGDVKSRLAAGAWIAGISMLLWLLSSVHGCAFCCASRKMKRTVKKQESEEDKLELDGLPNSQEENV